MATEKGKDLMTNEELVRKRGVLKAQLTRFKTFISTLAEQPLSPAQTAEVEFRLGRMGDIFADFNEVQALVELRCDDLNTATLERDQFEDSYFAAVASARVLVAPRSRTPSEEGSPAPSLYGDRLSPAPRREVRCKLPTISLPKFSGDSNTWLEFRDTFESLIHNSDMDNINKYHYLKASIHGNATAVIAQLSTSSSNYEVAWQLLCDRYDNKKLLVNNHVSSLFTIQPIHKESASSLRSLIDGFNKNLRALSSLGEPTSHWDTLLIHIGNSKLDSFTRRQWEEHVASLDTVTLGTFLNFLSQRAVILEMTQNPMARVGCPVSKPERTGASASAAGRKEKVFVAASSTEASGKQPNQVSKPPHCPKCKDQHWLAECGAFLNLPSNKERADEVALYKVCRTCLKPGHNYALCKKTICNVCGKKHHSLIHLERTPSESSMAEQGTVSSSPIDPMVSLSAHQVGQGQVLLSTALVNIYDCNNVAHTARCLLDSGSTACFMTEALCSKLNLPCNMAHTSVTGINNSQSSLTKICKSKVSSQNCDFSFEAAFYVLPTITGSLPSQEVNPAALNLPAGIVLADPTFYLSGTIDILLGADVFWDLLGSGRINLGRTKPTMCETKLGWVLSGHCPSKQQRSITCNHVSTELTRFWELDEATIQDPSAYYTKEEMACEEHFKANTSRLDGKFCIKLPLKQRESILGNSYERAKQQFLSMERRLQKDSTLKSMYTNFMAEYEALGDMTRLKNPKLNGYFLPHHGVLRMSSLSTKLRVVFNASSPSTTGISLNELLMVGPTIQDDLVAILIRFRQYTYVFSADVEKMYRRILVHPDDRHLQKIVWRSDPSQPIDIYELNTVTYGTASAPFLAVRCLKQLALECKDQNKELAEKIEHDFYVDDFISGAFEIDSALKTISAVGEVLKSAGMCLRKWRSNEPSLLSKIDSGGADDLNLGGDEGKTLGLGWRSKTDHLKFTFAEVPSDCRCTKRHILSVIGKLFDPLGLLGPLIIQAKILMQRLWLSRVTWDEEVPFDVQQDWIAFLKCLPALATLQVPRQVTSNNFHDVQLHIFCDASLKGYGACLYVRTINNEGVTVKLLMAKSRVAPLRPITIPRLELCGALIGAKLYKKAKSALRLPVSKCVFWTDSTVVLGWLKMLPNSLKTFVKHRVADILELTQDSPWRHVPTACNPADHLSRGLNAADLLDASLWWSGPEFLTQCSDAWPKNINGDCEGNEVVLTTSIDAPALTSSPGPASVIDIKKYSNFNFLKRVTAYVLRFIKNLKTKIQSTSALQSISSAYLSTAELAEASNLLCRLSQLESFPSYELVLRGCLPKKDSLTSLNPFVDAEGLMRVGGRLLNAPFHYDKKHPIIVHAKHHLAKLLFMKEHLCLLHAGPQAILASIRQRYWPIGGRNLAKHVYRTCVLCTRLRGATVTPIMGHLPEHRLTPGFPFRVAGIDYAGPIMAASKKGRRCQLIKVWIAVFVCFATKAVHLEVVSDLSTEGFMCVFRRFVARRSLPVCIYADNGTQFVGFANFLKRNSDRLSELAAAENITVKFIPPYSPHFAGLMESGVRCSKHHLVRVLGNCHFTYEELSTVLCSIEAILNSRPLTPLSSNPDDFLPLTPGHFLVGRPLTALPTPDIQIDQPMNRLTRYQRLDQLRQHFWTRWYKEYISDLQLRHKWKTEDGRLLKDMMVVVKDLNLPPMKWKLGRIEKTIPGPDGIVRVADIRTSSGVIRRSFSKICPLPPTNQDG